MTTPESSTPGAGLLPCEGTFDKLVATDPGQLLAWIRAGTLSPGQLTFAAEAAGHIPDAAAVRETLLPLLDAPSSLVREGALYGLFRHLDTATYARIQTVAERDPSPGVRDAARAVLDEAQPELGHVRRQEYSNFK